jgi:sulfatase modifying factor 1
MSIASMSIARITVFAAFVAGTVSGCKQSSQATQLAPPAVPEPQSSAVEAPAAAAPQSATSKDAIGAPGQAASVPSAIQPARPPDGMVYVPGGTFDKGPPESVTGKAPQATQVAPFFLDRTEVTVEAYLACVRAKGCTASKPEEECNATAKEPRLRHPMNCITKGQAEQYCAGLGKRLPSEAEWEFAARGTDGRIYPWGNAPAVDQLCWQGKRFVVESKRSREAVKDTCPVGSFPAGASPFGALDMAGNVAEWTSTVENTYQGRSSFHTRGGSYWVEGLDFSAPEELHVRADQYEPFSEDVVSPRLGVRCAKNI